MRSRKGGRSKEKIRNQFRPHGRLTRARGVNLTGRTPRVRVRMVTSSNTQRSHMLSFCPE